MNIVDILLSSEYKVRCIVRIWQSTKDTLKMNIRTICTTMEFSCMVKGYRSRRPSSVQENPLESISTSDVLVVGSIVIRS